MLDGRGLCGRRWAGERDEGRKGGAAERPVVRMIDKRAQPLYARNPWAEADEIQSSTRTRVTSRAPVDRAQHDNDGSFPDKTSRETRDSR
jgi:hypothetical protein